jgi:hypothetical protein
VCDCVVDNDFGIMVVVGAGDCVAVLRCSISIPKTVVGIEIPTDEGVWPGNEGREEVGNSS